MIVLPLQFMSEEEVSASDLLEGDIVKVVPGGRVPADGVVGFSVEFVCVCKIY